MHRFQASTIAGQHSVDDRIDLSYFGWIVGSLSCPIRPTKHCRTPSNMYQKRFAFI
ncbi:hypothetical protein BDZ90DRAFT_229160 [Jaminaea rosea]|uniref:Uncharacterized protein n=1 Tax=Jaminaea rosea TaxID=1569628 RepID=A0A316UXU3_9BASI|nr:hypothetical protein BDZ90DRAFT_229160 [Jaminaea rosea]PWN30129.1 hypothetical protein BDZ90DRAFT_229160 [Jaminaea rosea]